jgi:chitinase
MKIRTSLFKGAAILALAALALLPGCGQGFSTAGRGSPSAPETPAHTVALSWTASTSPDISGYNVYRAVYTNSCGAFSKLNAEPNSSTLFTDSTVAAGASYCYATTAVNMSNQESSYSNVVSDVQIPSP